MTRSADLQPDRLGNATTGRAVVPATATLVLITGVGPFGTDMYLAGLPDLRRSLGVSATTAQLTLTSFIIGLALGQLVIGSISDALGRRKVALAGALIFTVLSAVCALAPNGAILVAARLGEGIAAGGGVVVGRAMVTDTSRGDVAARRFGTLASITFLGPILAPVIGGVVLAHGTWRTVFVLLTIIGCVMVLAVLAGAPETLPPQARRSPGFAATGRRMAELLRDWSFMNHVTVYCISAAGFFTYIGGSAIVLRSVYGVSAGLYSIIFATNAAAMAATGAAFRASIARVGARTMRSVGLSLSAAAAVGLLVTALLDRDGSLPIAVPWVLMCAVVAGTGLTVPATTVLAQEAGRRAAGTAASLQGGIGFTVGAIVTPLTGVIGFASLLPMASAMATFYLAAFVLLLILIRRPADADVDAAG